MLQHEYLSVNKPALELRAAIIRLIREFFWSQNFLEVETPLILKLPGQEPHLSPVQVSLHNEKGEAAKGFLHTSPEYAMKKMLAAGFQNIFSICKCFRDYESFGGRHNPEFTMIEWYRTNVDFWKIMDDVENLWYYLAKNLKLETRNQKLGDKNSSFNFPVSSFVRIHMRDLWKKYVNANLNDYLTQKSMFKFCQSKGHQVKNTEPYEDLFFRIFLNEIEPKLENMGAIFIYNYPAQMAALAKLNDADPRYAERFELYLNGIELANAFSELTDPQEQRRRLKKEREERKSLGKTTYDIDEDFIAALGTMPPSAGIAMGIDRLVQALAGCQNIDDVIVLPASKLFN